ncbi:MAG: RNA polymerase subunit sigma-70 [Epulopiscium sp. Nele67-Bin002]|nr:MAG: RNA polymerase subunit sigma-70 [Epulopiscium sp. Nele67-Bin002]
MYRSNLRRYTGMLYFSCFSYFSSITSFPPPLSAEEERHYLDLYAKGDMQAKDILIERNLRLVAHIVKKYSNLNKEMDDLISIGTIGLIKGITSFDASKGTRLATYVARCIDNEILMSVRSSKKQNKETSLHSPIGMDKEGNEISLLDILCIEDNTIFEQVDSGIESTKLYEKIKEVLKPREKEILQKRYGLNNQKEKTQREIAEELGISRSYVSRIEKKALKRLFQELNK